MNVREVHQNILHRARIYAAPARRFSSRRRRPSGLHRSRYLAAAITARYAILERRWPALALVYQQRGELGVSILRMSPQIHSSILLNARLLLGTPVTHREESQRFAGRTVVTQSIGRDEASRTWAVPRKAPQEARMQETVIERVLSRAVREESLRKTA